MLPVRDRVDLGVMVMKGYSAFPQAPALLEPHHQIVYRNILDTRWWAVLPLWREAVGVLYCFSWVGKSSHIKAYLFFCFMGIAFYFLTATHERERERKHWGEFPPSNHLVTFNEKTEWRRIFLPWDALQVVLLHSFPCKINNSSWWRVVSRYRDFTTCS